MRNGGLGNEGLTGTPLPIPIRTTCPALSHPAPQAEMTTLRRAEVEEWRRKITVSPIFLYFLHVYQRCFVSHSPRPRWPPSVVQRPRSGGGGWWWRTP